MLGEKVKKSLALLLAMVLVLGLAPLGAYADGDGATSVDILKNGELVEGKDTEGYCIKALKSIVKKSGTQNQFTITLDLATSVPLADVTCPGGTDVVLVVDTSAAMCKALVPGVHVGSSCEEAGCAIADAKAAACDFVRSFLGEPEGDRRVGLVNLYGLTNLTPYTTPLTDSVSTLENAIDQYAPGGGRPTGQALMLARDMLKGSTASHKYIILITCGVPTVGGFLDGTLVNPGKYAEYFAATAKEAGIELYAAGCDTSGYGYNKGSDPISLDRWLRESVVSDEDHFWATSESAQLNASLGLMQTAIAAASSVRAWYVTDPMSQYVAFKNLVAGPYSAGGSYDEGTQAVTWDLKGISPYATETCSQGKITCSYYRLRYDISVTTDTAFYYAIKYGGNGIYTDPNTGVNGVYTNGITTLHYRLPGKTKGQTLNFDVPVVTGELPTYQYTIEYYQKDKTTGNYQLADSSSSPISAAIFETVSAPAGYETKYQNYQLGGGPDGAGSVTSMQITADHQVMKLYYDPIQVYVTVHHHVITTVSDGGPEQEKVSTETPEGPFYIGDSYTATPLAGYTIDSTRSDNYINIKLAAGMNTLNLYYTAEAEERESADYTIDYWYRVNTWKLNSQQKYELNYGTYEKCVTPGIPIAATAPAGTTMVAPLDSTKSLNDEYDLDTGTTGETRMVLKAGVENHLDIYYQKNGPEPEKATLQVTHIYNEKTATGYVTLGTVNQYNTPIDVHVGETWQVDPVTDYGGETDWGCVTGSEGRSKRVESGENTILVFYTRAPLVASVTVNHYYYAQYWGTEDVVDPVTGDTTSTPVPMTPDTPTETETETLPGSYYEGDSATAAVWNKNGYTPRTDNVYTILSLAAGDNVINLYYDKALVEEGTEEVDVTVRHVYNTYTTYIDAEGNTVRSELSANSKEDTYSVPVNIPYTVSPDFTDANGDSDGYLQVKPNPGGTGDVTFTPTAPDSQFVFTYARYLDDREETQVTVTPVYVTMSLDVDGDGNLTWTEVDADRETGSAWSPTDKVYAGQKLSALPAQFDKDGYVFDPDHAETSCPYQNVLLCAADQPTAITLVYVKKVAGDQASASVEIRNHYTFRTIASDGSEKVDPNDEIFSYSLPGSYWEGQSIVITSAMGVTRAGYVLDADHPDPLGTLTLSADVNQVDFYYYGEKDLRPMASVVVRHHYTETNLASPATPTTWDFEVKSTGWYAGQVFVAAPEYPGLFTLSHIKNWNPEDALTQTVGIPLTADEEGETANFVDIWYERTFDTRTWTSVSVTHHYSTTDLLNETKVDYTVTNTVGADSHNCWVGGSYTAAPVFSFTKPGEPPEEYEGYEVTSYQINGGDINSYDGASSISIDSLATEGNSIVINYLRKRATVTVNYSYITRDTYNGGETSTTGTPFSYQGFAGDKFTPPRQDMDGYILQTVLSEITLAAGSQTFDVRYLKTINSDPGSDDPDPPTPNPPTPNPPEEEQEEKETPLNLPQKEEIPEETPESEETAEVQVVEDTAALGKLPQTGTTAQPVNSGGTLGMLALSFSMAAVGLAVAFGRKKDEEQQ